MKNILITIITVTFLLLASIVMAGDGKPTFSGENLGTMIVSFSNRQSLSNVVYTDFTVFRSCTDGEELAYPVSFNDVRMKSSAGMKIDTIPLNCPKEYLNTDIVVRLENGANYSCPVSTSVINLINAGYTYVYLNFNFGKNNVDPIPHVDVSSIETGPWAVANCTKA